MLERWKVAGTIDKARYAFREARPLARFLVGYSSRFMRGLGKVDEEAFVDLVGRDVLGRALLPEEVSYFETLRRERGVGRWPWLASFFRLPSEVERRLYRRRALDSHHEARVKLIREHLPEAERILDIGGASDTSPEGNLLGMGYPFQPKTVWIVDLPPEKRIYTKPEVSPKVHRTEGGTEVRYLYSSMTDLSSFEGESFDLVWSGQSIEHVTEEEADKVVREVWRCLRPGGYFCLDTPNRKITELIDKTRFIHPEHKTEYTPERLSKKLGRVGFVIEEMKAVTPLPISARIDRFCKLEAIREVAVTDDYDAGFSFFVKARKP